MRFSKDLVVGEAGVDKKIAVLVRGEEFEPDFGRMLFNIPCDGRTRAAIDFPNEEKPAAGFEDPKSFAEIIRQFRPPETSFDGGDEIEHIIREGKLGDRAETDIHAILLDPVRVGYLLAATLSSESSTP